MRSRNSFTLMLASLLVAATPAVAQIPQTSAPVHKPAGTVTHSAHAKHRASEPRGQMAPTADRITEIQTALAHANAYQGDPTGIWDAATIEAMKTFQTAQALPPTGKIDALTLQRLGLGSDVAGKGAPTPPVASQPATPSASMQGDNSATQ
jgi:peptidoglycan hydrolase-like protein with peptidoglycan-binding domain